MQLFLLSDWAVWPLCKPSLWHLGALIFQAELGALVLDGTVHRARVQPFSHSSFCQGWKVFQPDVGL